MPVPTVDTYENDDEDMVKKQTLTAADAVRALPVNRDVIDLRDRYYVPSLVPLRADVVPNHTDLNIRDQFDEGACTGFALAAVVDCQRRREGLPGHVSTRMLFEMARLHDDLPDPEAAGSTLRGALKGFFHNGVCDEVDAPYLLGADATGWDLDIETAHKARDVTLGSYFRLNHEINDYHAAINEAGAVIASGKIHAGWARPKNGVIKRSSRIEGGHAFAIVGYTRDGFLVQNSWGPRWGGFQNMPGVALWSYEDWFEHVEDAWVLRLAVSSPSAFDVKYARNHAMFRDAKVAASAFAPRRQDIHGHFMHLDDGQFVSRGRYTQNKASLDETAKLIKSGGTGRNETPDYRHLLIFAHGALSNKTAVAKRIRAWSKVYKKNGIYPIHIMWETGFNSDVVDVFYDLLFKTRNLMGEDADHTDARLEEMAGPLGRKLWRDLKVTSGLTFAPGTQGGEGIRDLVKAARQAPELQVHFASASAGVLLLAELADVMQQLKVPLASANVMAPACNLDHYNNRIRPHLGQTIQHLYQYSLIDQRECADTLDIYSKSLLYLVSNALEPQKGTPMLGMETGLQALAGPDLDGLPAQHSVYFAGRDRKQTDAKSHTGLDRDLKTMNHILQTIVGGQTGGVQAFSQGHMQGY
ncbi:C1 family peptidase [Algirhabdus cladophorae]|uniref:C1 family peptidase n=1 Tax=Algirhabdus cladophorae TaxID=3377108 RepID=UPI003B848C7F